MILSYEVQGDITLLHLGTKRKGYVATSLIDTEDLEKVLQHTWHAAWTKNSQSYYVKASGGRLLLHRLVMNAPNDKQVDHKYGDTLDNRKGQLRICTHQQNMMNRRLMKENQSGIRGVYFDKTNGRWRGAVYYNNKVYRKWSNTKEDAATWVAKKRKELHGDFLS